MIKYLVLFLILNFGGLAIGGLFTGEGVPSEWYNTLDKAPWTPPGWVFGTAWTLIMILFAFYMSKAWDIVPKRKVLALLFGLQWILNVGWNPVFFHFHLTGLGLLIICLLTLLVLYLLLRYLKQLNTWSLCLLPYFIWLLIASSLNFYIVLYN